MSQEMTLGQLVRTRRLALGLSQTELAERTGLLQSDISRIERGSIQLPRFARLQRLAEVLEVPLGALLAASIWTNDDSDPTSDEVPATSSH